MEICAFCKVRKRASFFCEQCHITSYCSIHCQLSDNIQHKLWCQSFCKILRLHQEYEAYLKHCQSNGRTINAFGAFGGHLWRSRVVGLNPTYYFLTKHTLAKQLWQERQRTKQTKPYLLHMKHHFQLLKYDFQDRSLARHQIPLALLEMGRFEDAHYFIKWWHMKGRNSLEKEAISHDGQWICDLDLKKSSNFHEWINSDTDINHLLMLATICFKDLSEYSLKMPKYEAFAQTLAQGEEITCKNETVLKIYYNHIIMDKIKKFVLNYGFQICQYGDEDSLNQILMNIHSSDETILTKLITDQFIDPGLLMTFVTDRIAQVLKDIPGAKERLNIFLRDVSEVDKSKYIDINRNK